MADEGEPDRRLASFIPVPTEGVAELVSDMRPGGRAESNSMGELHGFPFLSSAHRTEEGDRSLPTVRLAQSHRQSESMSEDDAEAKTQSTEEKVANEARLAKVYEAFQLDALWAKLGEALSRLRADPSSAQVLLPTIESLMVVSRHALKSDLQSTSQAEESMPGNPNSSRRAQMEQEFLAFTEQHRKILNLMVRQNPSLMSGSFALLVKNSKVLDFDNKRNYFTQQLHKGRREHYTPLSLSVRRKQVFHDSFQFFQRRSGPEIKHGKLSVRFHNEDGVDAGGVTREWFQVLSREMFNPDYALFQPCAADRTTYQPNRMSSINDMHLAFFTFIGRIIGKAIYDARLLDAYFTRSFYKHMLGRAVDYKDLEAVDPEYYNSLEWMLHNDITDILELTFAMEEEVFGETSLVELLPDGAAIPVTNENKHEYVRLVTEQRLTKSIQSQIDAFLTGFHEIIPRELIEIFSEQELELLISGLPDIDVDEWKNHTELRGYNSSDPMIQWFWRAVRSFDQTEKAKLLQFITGTSKVPLEGFAHLQGVQGTQRFNIHRAYGEGRLPAAHTCFNQLDLPSYESYERLRSQLLLAMNEGGEGFGLA
ncbi:HECT-type E3 ubiquitin transferase [Malassezia yamatoensis]|uniref:HECT-type E3 ubiquitin transferase n=1 Tax=Malassezia yamatoensis TaxID=253288 RepID=A0AAJ6CEL6_9BASI|nr:HECT-type E3 ubiquitin transferase [Malassezia yamatoensis]